MDVINRRHRMAQMAGRASVEFYVGLALKGRAETLAKASGAAPGEGITEDAFVIRTFRNGVGVFVFQCVTGSSRERLGLLTGVFCRLGLEGLVTFKRDVQFDADNYTVMVPPSASAAGGAAPVAISVFDKVKVRIEVEKDRNTQRGRVRMTLLSPVDSRGL
jgi:exosome complex exonuclease DIS3/RRP44